MDDHCAIEVPATIGPRPTWFPHDVLQRTHIRQVKKNRRSTSRW